MKPLIILGILLLFAHVSISQTKTVSTKPNIQQLQKIKIVAKTANDETPLVSQMNDLEIKLISIQERQKELQLELETYLKDQAELKKKLESMSEMTETSALRMQMFMDRRSKMMSTLSNILKKMSDTQQSIINNLK